MKRFNLIKKWKLKRSIKRLIRMKNELLNQYYNVITDYNIIVNTNTEPSLIW